MKKIFTNLKIRRVNREDLPEIIKIIKKSYHKKYAAAGEYYSVQQFTDPNYATENGPYYSLGIFVESMISDLKNKFKKPFEFFVAEFNKELIAFIILEKNRQTFWVNNVIVKKEFQGKDIGRRLFEFVVKNKKPVYLWVNSKNPAKKFWSELGFKEILQETLMFRS
ncbi:GNAT family N-acetyltransferase [Patescibacteria group bacterium]|nr:GNAT family N-acetyltransferase [Patescibacteria group bacterium]